MRLIDADAFREVILAQSVSGKESYPIELICDFIDEQTAIEAVPVVHAEWIADERGIYYCSVCDSEAYWDAECGQQLFDHCPYCGADMRKKV